jgi:hypothetical protein
MGSQTNADFEDAELETRMNLDRCMEKKSHTGPSVNLFLKDCHSVSVFCHWVLGLQLYLGQLPLCTQYHHGHRNVTLLHISFL